jgi:superfamily I DNA/RNA helicase
VGRTINKRFDLDRNYRNTREILRIAAEFVSVAVEPRDPESSLQIIKPDPNVAVRSGPVPEMLAARSEKGELQIAVEKIDAWLKSELKPSEIAVLYRANVGGWVRVLASLISQRAAVYWPQDKSGTLETLLVFALRLCIRQRGCNGGQYS